MSLRQSTSFLKKERPIRDSGIELLRILIMCGVVILHYNGYIGQALTRVTPNTWNHTLLLSLEGLFICAVNLFVLITGYFSCTSQSRPVGKALGLIVQVIVFNGVLYLAESIPQGAFGVKPFLSRLLPTNYFVILYVALYFISPYINLAMQNLERKQLSKLLIVSLLLFSVWPTVIDIAQDVLDRGLNGMNSISAYGDDRGYTIVNFTLMYLLGAYIRLADIQVKKRWSFAAVVVLTVVLAYTGKLEGGAIAWSYCNPLVIGQAAALFLLFHQIPLRSRMINALAKGSFTCFLLHPYLLAKFRVDLAVQKNPLYLFGHILVACVSIYLVAWVVYQIYNFVSNLIVKIVTLCFKKRTAENETTA